MIGSGLKKLAKQNQMTVASGVAYGSLHGYATTLSEGAGWKKIDISTRFTELGRQEQLQAAVNEVDLRRTYRVQDITFGQRIISIIFLDNPGTMKKIEAFIAWFYPLLDRYGAMGADICSECGCSIESGGWYLIDGVAHHFHDACADQINSQLQQDAQQRKEADTGSYLQGFVGALLGSLLGAIVWAVVLYGGYVASLVGLLIGWLAEKGYTLFRGKQGKGKIAILIVVIILGVLLGSMIPDVVTVADMINTGELEGFTHGDIPALLLMLMTEDAEYLSATLSNIGMGLLFAALGVFGLLHKASKEVTDTKMKKLR